MGNSSEVYITTNQWHLLMMDIKIIWTTIKQVLAREDVGVATSGTNDFNDYREREWAAQGRQDLIDKARREVDNLKNRK